MALPPLCSSPCSVSAGHSWLRWRQKQCPDYSCSRPGRWLCWLWRRPKLSVRGRGTKRSLILAKALDYARKGLGAVLTHIPAASELERQRGDGAIGRDCGARLFAGLVARTVTAHRVVDALELSVLSIIPAYEYLKREGASALGVAGTAALPVVFAPMEGGWQVGVQTNALSARTWWRFLEPATRHANSRKPSPTGVLSPWRRDSREACWYRYRDANCDGRRRVGGREKTSRPAFRVCVTHATSRLIRFT